MQHFAFTELTEKDKHQLLQLARYSIKKAADHDRLSQPKPDDFSPALQQQAACFVTLTQDHELRGCIGSLEAHQSLVNDVVTNAQSAASRDPRFPHLTHNEVANTHIEISVLSPLEEINFNDENDLLNQIEPIDDGLVLQESYQRGTFLPLVWDKIPDKKQFLQQLKLKAGLPIDYWSDTLKVYRYHTIVFEE